ncbi:hypothetical protein CMK11_07860 [Candidatus Poribacteria bacterium]|nr:hypothetical protein [Candidatus Poribacteria bacterium]
MTGLPWYGVGVDGGLAVRYRRALRFLLACGAVVAVSGCGEAPSEDDLTLEPAYVIGIRPAPGGVICEGQDIVVVFNRDPGDARCDAARLYPDVQAGSLRTFWATGRGTLSFAWDNGGALAVEYHVAICEYEPPMLVSAFPDDREPVSLDALQERGIVLVFDVEVYSGSVDWDEAFALTGPDGWAWDAPVTAEGRRVTLGPPAPGVFEADQTYGLRGVVTDDRGNETEISLTIVIAEDDE